MTMTPAERPLATAVASAVRRCRHADNPYRLAHRPCSPHPDTWASTGQFGRLRSHSVLRTTPLSCGRSTVPFHRGDHRINRERIRFAGSTGLPRRDSKGERSADSRPSSARVRRCARPAGRHIAAAIRLGDLNEIAASDGSTASARHGSRSPPPTERRCRAGGSPN